MEVFYDIDEHMRIVSLKYRLYVGLRLYDAETVNSDSDIMDLIVDIVERQESWVSCDSSNTQDTLSSFVDYIFHMGVGLNYDDLEHFMGMCHM
jgi:hypothetical protein